MSITIQVTTQYEPSISNVKKNDFFFSYTIKIHNNNGFPIQILYRYWDILDFVLENRKVEGAGIIGEQPIIQPQHIHTYSSFCFLRYPFGRMRGNYLVKNVESNEEYNVDIPVFALCIPYLCN